MLTKIKKGICFLLSALQIGLLSGCNNISKEEYDESLKKIEQLEKDNNSLEENVAKLEQEKEKLEQEITKLKEEFNYQLPINYSNPFNINLATEIGLTEEIFNNDNLKDYIDEFNTYISSYENVLYSIENNEDIAYYVNNECIGKISASNITTSNEEWLNFTYYKSNIYYSHSLRFKENKIIYTDYDASWSYENNNYNMGIIVNNNAYTTYEAYIGFNSILNEEEKLYINLIQNKNHKNILDINAIMPIYVTDNNHVNFEIDEEDFQKINSLILTYKDSNKFEDAFSYCRATILDIIKKYNKETECLPYMDILTGNNIYKESKNLSNEMLIEMGIEETFLNNKDIQNSISQINQYLNNIEGNVNYKISIDFNGITFYLNGKNILQISYSAFDHAFSYNLVYDNYTTYTDIVIYDTNINTEEINNQIIWLYDDTMYLIGTQKFNDGRIIKEINNEDLNILIYKNTDSYNISIANKVDDSKKWNININQDYFEFLSNMIDNYQINLDLGNVIAYLEEDLLSIIKDCTSEDEFKEIASLFNQEQVLTR